MRISAVQRAVRNEYHVSLTVDTGIVVQRQVKGAGNNPDDFIVTVPVIGHVIARAVGDFMIKSNRKVKGALLSLFFIIKVFHLIRGISFRDTKR